MRGGRQREQRASARVRLAQVRTALSQGATCQPDALKIAAPAGAVAGGGAGLGTLNGYILGPWALVVLSLSRSPCDLCLECLGRGFGKPL